MESGHRSLRASTTDRAIAAAKDILIRDGYARLTMEGVAAASGVAKTSLYRRWATKAALCMDLYLEEAGREIRDPDTGRVESDLKHITRAVVRLQTETVAGAAFAGMIAEMQLSPETRPAFQAEFAERRREVTRVALKRGVTRGELKAGTDIDLVIDAIGGAVTFRLLQGHAPLSSKFVDELIDLVLRGCSKLS